MTASRTTLSPACTIVLASLAFATCPGSAHDEDWRKLVDRVGAVEGPIFRLSDDMLDRGGLMARAIPGALALIIRA